MIACRLFGLAALLPMALGTGPAAAGGLSALVCTGTGEARVVTVPLGRGLPVPGKDRDSPCAKACHAGGPRKRAFRGF